MEASTPWWIRDWSLFSFSLPFFEKPSNEKIAHVCDALTSKRPYRDAMSHEAALKIMVSGVGSQFEPHVMEHFWEIVKFNYKNI
ncbi:MULTISPECIES: hypothetical protein [Metabacillus]|uniref:HD-GYP domain-containing protein n=2 Tax=Metabacillus TaxID=2675233 RepID=A0A179T9C4_9BACI|nr:MULTISPECIES: hypothetical protein [Metabacillus]OAS89012.1 hypothetical protein A6K24_00125 [Metabacillus litoralis]QNF28532.1 hypothetical protein HUW50_14215 [Metabacillus sp. KUDC1714]